MLQRFFAILSNDWVRATLYFFLFFFFAAVTLNSLDAFIFATIVSFAIYLRKRKREQKSKITNDDDAR